MEIKKKGYYVNDIECPYCGVEQEIDHEDGYGYEEGQLHEQACSSCQKMYTYTTATIYCYEAFKADCLNGGEHIWKPKRGVPKEYFMGKFACETCEAEKIDKKENAKGLAILREQFSKKAI